MLSYPTRWYYDILRALDYFQAAEMPYDHRMEDALEVLVKKRRKDFTPASAEPVSRTNPFRDGKDRKFQPLKYAARFTCIETFC